MKRPLRGARTIVTGASSGIGRALARELATEGAKLALTARRLDRLQALAAEAAGLGGESHVCAGDITEPEVRRQVVELARRELGGLDVLVNNAGIGAWGRFDQATPERLRQIMEVNFFSLVELTRAALPLLKEGRLPIIVNISSILGMRGVPRSSEYCASKFAVHGFSQALRAELSPWKIDVLVVSPGTTDTDFFDVMVEKQGDRPWPEQPRVSAASVAKATVRAMRKGQHEIIPNRRARVMNRLNRLSPYLLDRFLARYG